MDKNTHHDATLAHDNVFGNAPRENNRSTSIEKLSHNTSSSHQSRHPSKHVPLSILDLCPKCEGSTRKKALDNSLDLAMLADECGYKRFWMAEHHGSTVFMSSATSLLLMRAAEHTKRIRLGAGGVMLPNHTTLMVAEYYGTLATLYPDRIDIGIGRAPGTDPITAAALRRGSAELDDFSRDIIELTTYLDDACDINTPQTLSGAEAAILGIPYHPQVQRRRVRAIPGEGTKIPLWLLSSSPAGAHIAAELGLPYAFASHFAGSMMAQSVQAYRNGFQGDAPWARIHQPYVMTGVQVMVAPTHDEAVFLASTAQQLRCDIRRGIPTELKPPTRKSSLGPADLRLVDVSGSPSFDLVGTPDEVVHGLESLVDFWHMDEIIIVNWAYDPQLRQCSYRLLAEAW